MTEFADIHNDIEAIKEKLANHSALSIFMSEKADGILVESLLGHLGGDGVRLVEVEAGASYMDYIGPLLETEGGDTVVLDGVQNIDTSLIADFLRVISDRVLVGTIGEGENAQSFEMPMNSFNLVLIDRGGGETSLIRNAFDDQIAIDVFARGIKPPSATQEMGDGDMLSLLSTFVNQCVPDCGWFEGDEECSFSLPDGSIVVTKQEEVTDADTWVELYSKMKTKLITDVNGASLLDEEAKEYLEDEGNLYHFKYEFNFPTGEITYEMMQFGSGEIAAECTESHGVKLEELEQWVEKSAENNWIPTREEDRHMQNVNDEFGGILSKDSDRFALVWAQYTEDNRSADDLSSEVSDISEDMKNMADNFQIVISDPYFVKFSEPFDNSFNGRSDDFEILSLSELTDTDEDTSEDEVQQAIWIVNFAENYDFSEDFNLEEVAIRLNIPSLSARTDPYAYNLFLINKKNQKVMFQAWEAGDQSEGQLTDPDDDDFRYNIKNISNFVNSLIGL